MPEARELTIAKQLLSLKEANQTQIEDLLIAMEEYDKSGTGTKEVTLPPSVARYLQGFFNNPGLIPATLSLEQGFKPELVTADSFVVPLQKLVFTVDLPASASITTDGRFGNPRAVITYTPIYPIPGKEEDYGGLFLERSAIVRQEGKSSGAVNEPLEKVIHDKTGEHLFPQVTYPRRKLSVIGGSQPSFQKIFHHNMRLASAVNPLEAQQVINTLRAATPQAIKAMPKH